MRLSVLVFVSWALSGCVSLGPLEVKLPSSVQSTSVPDWVLQPPVDDAVLYGVGEGRSLAEAKSAALASIAQGISTDVKSEQTTLRQKMQNTATSQTTIKLNLTTPRLTMDNHKIERSVQANGQFYVLVSVARQPLIDKQYELKNTSDRLLLSGLEGLKSRGPLEQALLLAKNTPLMEQGIDRSLVLMALDPAQRDTYRREMQVRYVEPLAEHQRLKNTFTIQLTQPASLAMLGQSVKSLLSQKGYRFGPSDSLIELQVNEHYKPMFGAHNVRLDIQIHIKQGSRLLHTHQFTVNGTSVQSREAALRQANLNAQEKVRAEASELLVL
jgi:hypothetical protein